MSTAIIVNALFAHLLATLILTLSIFPQSYAAERPWEHGELRVSDNGRYLQHKDGTPFFWLGDIQGDVKKEVWETLANTIKENDKNHLMTFHPRGRVHRVKGARVQLPLLEGGAGGGRKDY